MNKKIVLTLLLLFAFCISVNAVETSLFGDNFNDGSIADWDQNSGTWSAVTQQLQGIAPGTISHTVPSMTSGRSYRFYYRNDANTASLENSFYWFTDQNGTTNLSGYGVTFTPNLGGTLKKYSNGVGTTLLLLQSLSPGGTFHDVNISHSFDGNIQVWVDGLSQGSVIDNNFHAGTRIVFDVTNTAGTGKFEDVNVFFTGDTNTSFKVVDEENTTIGLDATMTINGNDWPVSSLGNFDINSSVTFPVTISISKTGYDSRNFYFDTNAGLYQYTRFGLRSSSEAKDISFIFFAPDEATKLTNRFIRVIKNNVNAGAGETTSDASITYNLAPQDSDYRFLTYPVGIESGTPDYNYGSVTVTVNQPKNEVTNLAITPNSFNLDVGGLGLQNYTAQALPISTIIILGNTEDVYNLRVIDNNSDGQQYFARNYIMQVKGDTSSLTIQPYLIDIDDGILVNLYVKNIGTNQTIPDIRVQMLTGINSAITVVEDRPTDALGVAQMVMLSQKTYSFSISSLNQDVNYFSANQAVSASSTSITFWIVYNDNSFNITSNNTTIFINPTTTILTNSPQVIDVNIDTNVSFDFIYVQAYDSNTLIDQNNCSSSPCNVKLTINLTTMDTNFLNIKMVIQNNDFNYTKQYNYIVSAFTNNIVNRIRNLKNEIGPVPLGVIMFLMVMGFIAFVGGNPFGNNMSQIFLIIILFGAFYWLWFIETNLFVGFLAGVFGVMLIYFWARQKGGP